MKSLSAISKKLKTTKKVHNFFPIYEKYFQEFKNKRINLLEIGFTKNSLSLFKRYFPKANIVGLDLNKRTEDFYKKA